MQITYIKKLTYKYNCLNVLFGLFIFSGVTSCGSSNSHHDDPIPPVITAQAITIDNAGIIPVFGSTPTATVLYVHNNSQVAISGITYSNISQSNVIKNNHSNKIINSPKRLSNILSAGQCSTIEAGQSCPLSITTPVLSAQSLQGSFEVKASYIQDGKDIAFTQIINYAAVQDVATTAGAQFSSGVNISGYGNNLGYATLYLYGSGQNQVYNVSSMLIDAPAINVVNGDISGHQIQSNFVQAVEVSSPILSSSINAKITVNSSINTSNSLQLQKPNKNLVDTNEFSNSVSLVVNPIASGAILTASLVPLINTVNGTNGSLSVHNSGSSAANIQNVTAGVGISNLSGCSNTSLASGATCVINFTVSKSGGSATITIPYTSGTTSSSLDSAVTWFDGTSAALVAMSSSQNPITFTSGMGESTAITVTNIGGYELTSINIPAPVVASGSATATLVDNNCDGITLAIGSSCSYTINVSDAIPEVEKQLNVGFNASYIESNGVTSAYSRIIPVTYNSTPIGAIIAVTPTTINLSIIGNSVESTTSILTVSNNGDLPATISNLGFNNSPSYLSAHSTCSGILAAKTTCLIALALGPTLNANSESGVSIYSISYASSASLPSGSVSSTVNWAVQSYDRSLSLTNQTADGVTSGSGTAIESYVFSGNNNDAKQIALTYTNTGDGPITITGVQNYISSSSWSDAIGSINSPDPICGVGVTLAVNTTCDIIYTNVLSQTFLELGNIGAVYQENIEVPTISYQDANNPAIQFEVQPNLPYNGGTIIYAQSQQATLANSVVVNESGTIYESYTVTSVLANATGYTDVYVMTEMEDYASSAAPVYSPTCSSSVTDGIREQGCTLSENQLFGTATYMVNQALLNNESDTILTASFSTNAVEHGLIVSMDESSDIANLGMAAPTFSYAYIVNGGTVAGGITQCLINDSTGSLGSCSLAIDGGFSRLRGIAINESYAYVTNATGSVDQCPISSTGIGACSNAGSGLSSVKGIAFNNGYAYITSVISGFPNIQQCTVNSISGALSNCVTAVTYGENDSNEGITISNGYLYNLNYHHSNYSDGVDVCAINPITGILSGCVQSVPEHNDGNYDLQYGSSIAINNSYAYVTIKSADGDYANSVVKCVVNQNGTLANSCTPTGSGFVVPYGIAISNGFAYITNQNGVASTISTCEISTVNGDLINCVTGGSNLNGPFGIAIAP